MIDNTDEAVKIVNSAIVAREVVLSITAETDNQEDILIVGKTITGHECSLLVDPKPLAQILLRHNYPTWRVLDVEPPKEMWEEVAKFYGLASQRVRRAVEIDGQVFSRAVGAVDAQRFGIPVV